ncbi:MAG TPA: septum site-determining protein MinD, partial [Candidatus Aenigmarchaeota archaeon]|nr:septum site-determining protein MinD [Candidatus Aenigmarchaeota archaeon]
NRVIGVVSGKGGVGKTTFVANVGLSLVEINNDVTVIDADISTSNLGMHLNLYQFPLGLQNVLDGDLDIFNATYMHPTGLKVIPTPLYIQNPRKSYSPNALKNLLENEAGIFIIDSPPGLNRNVDLVLKASNEVIVITTPDIASVTDAMKTVKLARDNGIKNINIAVNRVSGKYELTREEIESACDAEVIGEIPEDKAMKACLMYGTPIVLAKPYSKSSIAFRTIAAKIMGKEYQPPRFLFIKRLFG